MSIVIPVFNHEKYLDGSIRSVLAQRYPRVECIVVDDGSTDESFAVANKYSDRVCILRQANKGQVAALNAGFAQCHGAYIGYLSADDLLDEDAIEQMMRCVQALGEPPSPVVVFPLYRTIDAAGLVLEGKLPPFLGVAHMIEEFQCRIGPGALFPKALSQKHGGWNDEFKQIPDYAFWIKLSREATFCQVNRVLASWRVHVDSQSFMQSSSQKCDESLLLLRWIEEGRIVLTSAARRRRFVCSAYIFSACLHIRSGRIKTGMTRYFSALRHNVPCSLRPLLLRRMAACLLFLVKARRAPGQGKGVASKA